MRHGFEEMGMNVRAEEKARLGIWVGINANLIWEV